MDGGTVSALLMLMALPAGSTALIFALSRARPLTRGATGLFWLGVTALGGWFWLAFLGPWSSILGNLLLGIAVTALAGALAWQLVRPST
jgi:hypothetical protein